MLNVFDWLRSRNPAGRTATELYGSIVAQARHPDLYTELGVRDVAEKRYELIVLHLVLVLERLRAGGETAKAVSQAVVEDFVRDVDGSMREMAVGDTSVPRKVRKAAGGLYDRDELYRQAFDGAEDMTPAALVDELIFDGRSADGGERLARYIRGCRERLSEWSLEADGVAALEFPAPASFGPGDGVQ
jgi:cytochrome b pre-mRNA-processing protein 3